MTKPPRPLHRLGQHVLTDADVRTGMVRASNTDPRIPTIEVGAGIGVLTEALAQERRDRARQTNVDEIPLIAVEIDRRLIPPLIERTRGFPHVHILQGNILELTIERIFASLRSPSSIPPYDVIGNIPYNITAPILQKFLAHEPRPRRLTVLLDEAVADVIAAEPPAMSIRAISVQVYAVPQIIQRRIPPEAFNPPPAVHSAIVALETRVPPLVPAPEENAFFRLVRAGFSQKRKMLGNALAATFRLSPSEARRRLTAAGIEPSRRAQELSIPEWLQLLRAWSSPKVVH